MLLALLGPPAAADDQPGCGDVVTSDLTLTADLECEYVGLRLSPGVTLDLGGHRISVSGPDNSGAGVMGPESGSATITNGRIRAAGTAVVGLGGELTVTHVTAEGGMWGAGITADRLTVEHSTVTATMYGIQCGGCVIRHSRVGAAYYTVYGSSVVENSVMWASANGMVGHTQISDSIVTGQDTGIHGSATVVRTRFENVGVGVWATGEVTVVGSTFTGGGDGVLVEAGARATLVGNLFVDNSTGVRSSSGDVTLRHNTAVGNWVSDINAPRARQDGWNIGVGTTYEPAGPASEPSAAPCGTHLTASTTLTADVVCDWGITVADGVTLDLAGHTLRGPGTGTGLRLDGTASIRGGSVSGWAVGIWVPASASPVGDRRVIGTTVSDNGVGILAQAGALRTEQVTWRRNGTGLRCDSSCTVHGGVLTDHAGAAVDVTGSVDVRGTTARANGAGVLLSYAAGTSTVTGSTFFDNAQGIEAERSGLVATHGVLRRNTAAVTVSDGLTLPGAPPAPRVTLQGLVADGNDDGIVSTGTDVRLGANVATRNAQHGIHAPGGTDLGGNVGLGNGRSPQVLVGGGGSGAP